MINVVFCDIIVSNERCPEFTVRAFLSFVGTKSLTDVIRKFYGHCYLLPSNKQLSTADQSLRELFANEILQNAGNTILLSDENQTSFYFIRMLSVLAGLYGQNKEYPKAVAVLRNAIFFMNESQLNFDSDWGIDISAKQNFFINKSHGKIHPEIK
jgi:hypothetical protein